MLHDFIVSEVTAALAGRTDVRFRRVRGAFFVHFKDQLVIRFKKFSGATLKTSSIATQQTLAFDAQAFATGQDLQPLTHLVAGYVLDATGLAYARLAVTCKQNGTHLWEPINFQAPTAAIVTLPETPSMPAPVETKVTSKTQRNTTAMEGGTSKS